MEFIFLYKFIYDAISSIITLMNKNTHSTRFLHHTYNPDEDKG